MTQYVLGDGGRSRAAPRRGGMSGTDFGLYAFTVVAWSTSWFAMHMQVGVVAPEVSLIWRFLLATALMFAWAIVSGARLAFAPAVHLRFAVIGALLFSLNFVCFYYAGMSTPSGLLSVVFSCTSLINLVLGAAFFGEAIERRVAIGAAVGLAGVALMFVPQLTGAPLTHAAWTGLLLGGLGTVSFCCGNMVSHGARRDGIEVLSSTAWGMLYGTLIVTLIAVCRGLHFSIDWSVPYIGSLLWLTLVSSVGAYVFYLTLMSRIGPARAGYATVIFPAIALLVSTVVEGYVWTFTAAAGLILTFVGNLIVLTRRRRTPRGA